MLRYLTNGNRFLPKQIANLLSGVLVASFKFYEICFTKHCIAFIIFVKNLPSKMNAHAGFFFFLHQPFYFDEFLSKIERSCSSPPLPLRTIYLCGGWKPCCFLPSLSLSVSVSLCVLTSPASSGILSVAQPALLNTSGESPRPSF